MNAQSFERDHRPRQVPATQTTWISPSSPEWDHTAKCHSKADAEKSRDHLRNQLGTRPEGRSIKWRIRPCHTCGGFFVDREYRRPRKRSGGKTA